MATHPVSVDPAAGFPLWRRVVHSGLEHFFGPPPIDPDGDFGDPGLCGPGSASWEVIGDPSAMVGGLRALLVQLLHPHAMAGVYDHSAFRTDPLDRLRRTAGYVLATTFGSTREAVAVSQVVRRTHRMVRGVAPDGRSYAASDPHLLAWVSIALTSSFLTAHWYFAPRSVRGERADAFVAEQSRIAALLDTRVDLDALARDIDALEGLRHGELPLPMIEEGTLPTSLRELDETLARYRPELTMNEQGREGMRFLLWPPVPVTIKLPYLPLLAGALSTIPRDQRRLFGPKAAHLASPLALVNARVMVSALRTLRGSSPLVRLATARAESPSADPEP